MENKAKVIHLRMYFSTAPKRIKIPDKRYGCGFRTRLVGIVPSCYYIVTIENPNNTFKVGSVFEIDGLGLSYMNASNRLDKTANLISQSLTQEVAELCLDFKDVYATYIGNSHVTESSDYIKIKR
jgi:hypothetical protein